MSNITVGIVPLELKHTSTNKSPHQHSNKTNNELNKINIDTKKHSEEQYQFTGEGGWLAREARTREAGEMTREGAGEGGWRGSGGGTIGKM